MKEVTILQINDNDKLFWLKTFGLQFDKNDYKVVFKGTMEVNDAEDVYMRLKSAKPKGYKGHSLSVSDIVYMDGKYFFCDSFGFTDVTEKFNNN